MNAATGDAVFVKMLSRLIKVYTHTRFFQMINCKNFLHYKSETFSEKLLDNTSLCDVQCG